MEGHLGHGPAREATVAAAHHPDIQVPPDKGTWFQQTARRVHHLGLRLGSRETARQAARSSGLLPPLAPAQPTGTSPSPPRLQGAAWHRSRPECCSALCVRVSLVDTLTRVDTGSQVAIHRGHVGAASAQGEAWSSPPTVRKSQSARARPWIPAARVCPFPAFVPSVRPSRGGERVHSR